MNKGWIFLTFCFFILVPIFAKAQDFDEFLMPSIPGRVEGKGKYFQIKDSDYLNISLESSGEIEVVLESIPRMISLDISSSIDATTTLTIKGLEPNKTYFKYQDSYKEGAVFVSDENGIYSWQQDLTEPHHIWIQEEKGTIFIPEDCSKYGTWETSTQTCTLNQDLFDSVEITTSSIVVDCAGHSINGTGTGYGIYIKSKQAIVVKNCIISNFWSPILLNESSNNTFSGNTMFNNSYLGIYLTNSSTHNTVNGNNVNSTGAFGIYCDNSHYNSFNENKILNNSYGIGLRYSSSNNILNNNVVSKNYNGILLDSSSNNTITNNIVSSNRNTGIVVNYYSNNNEIVNNNLNLNYYGIYFWYSNGNKIYHNNFIDNSSQVYLSAASFNNYFDNGYPSGGNYWSDYQGKDEKSGENQGQPGPDGIGDTPYTFKSGQDRYPFMKENGWVLTKVLISEVYYDVAKDKGEEGDNEWVIIHNLESQSVDISGWQVCDNERCDEIPTSSIPANGFAILTPTSTTFSFWKIPNDMVKIVLGSKFGSHGLANDGDRVILKDKEGKIVDAMSYGDDKSIFDPPCRDVAEGKSLLRDPPDRDTDTKDDFIESEPTIGKNQPPIPIINFSPKNPVKGVKVKFDASSSTDPDGQILNFEWQIGTFTFSGTTTEFTFKENGEYQIILTATDNEGATSSTSTIIKISPFSFAIITDLHIGRGYPDYDSSGFEDSGEGEDYYLTERLKNVVQWIIDNRDSIQCENATCSIKFLAVLGDIADSAEKSEFLKAKKILDRLNDYGILYVPLFGNHDVWPYTDFDEATTSLGENYFNEIFWDENTTNTKLMKEILNWQRDKNNPKYKNFAFDFGGINFIGLDFNSREKTKESGVKGEAVNYSETINWLKEKLNEFGGKESVIIFSHEPFAEPNSRILYKISRKEILFPLPQGNFSEKELAEIKKILKDYESKSEGQQILVNFGGHIHGFEKLGKEIKFFGQFSPIDLYFDANWQYPSLSTVPVLTTEALMVGGNEENLSNKGLVRIAKINDKENIDFSEIEAKFPALNPYITFEYKILPDQVYPCVFFKAHLFSEREYTILWDFGDGKTGTGVIETHCYSPLQVPQTYSIKLTATDKKTNNKEDITRKVMIKEGIIPKVIKIAEKTKEKVELISNELGEKVTEFGRTMRDWVEIRVKHSPSTPVGMINVHFERASNDINLTNLTVDVDLEKKKSLLYVPEWPEIIEENKVLFIPK